MSVFFAALIGIVIIGFFAVSYVDINVRRSIFGGQAGLQFLTLFSIVIAIILFGITNILEGRELAALLGGLSGYILGKYSSQGGDSNHVGNSSVNLNSIVSSINIAPASVTLSVANPTQQLSVRAIDAQNNPITSNSFIPQWSSDNLLVAIVDQTGLITRVATGNCNVSATFNGTVSNNCVVVCS